MRLARFRTDDSEVIAAAAEDGTWVPVGDLAPDAPGDMLGLLDGWPQLKAHAEGALAGGNWQALPADAEPLLPFRPASLRDFMLSETHAVEAARGYLRRFKPGLAKVVNGYEKVTGKTFPALKPKPLWYRQPVYYLTNHLNVISDGATVDWPDYTEALDYELELAFVITKPLLNATREEAEAAIGGFLILNDFSARDVQLDEMKSGFGPQKCKHFVNALSASVATADDVLPRIDTVKGEVRINGERIVESRNSDLQHDAADVLVHVSRAERLHPGEVFGLGTMPGGCAMENGRWLAPGDEIELAVEGIGTLTNRIGRRGG
jgi:2-keto-4-pentenoate hydratase/2-oxohepta-3-ene-1,7-dioic acid hydratase in catechol pathway